MLNKISKDEEERWRIYFVVHQCQRNEMSEFVMSYLNQESGDGQYSVTFDRRGLGFDKNIYTSICPYNPESRKIDEKTKIFHTAADGTFCFGINLKVFNKFFYLKNCTAQPAFA